MKKNVSKVLSVLLVSIVSLIAMLSCGSKIKEGVVRVGYMPYYASVPLQVIKDKGLDTKYGFEMEDIMFPSGGPMAEALGAGEWDIGQIGAGGMSAIPNYNAKLIADVQYEMDGAWMLARPDSDIVKAGANLTEWPEVIGSAETLEGLTVLGTVGNISHYMAIDYAQKFGLDISDVEFIHMETAQIANAFIAGEGDIACMGNPTAAMDIVADGYVRIGGLKQQGASQQDAMLVNEEYYESNKEDIVKFMKAWYEATAMLNADPNYEFEMTKKFYTGNGRKVSDASVQQECDFNSYIDANNFYNKETGAWMRGLIECYVENGTMEPETLVALEQNIVTEMTEQAINELK